MYVRWVVRKHKNSAIADVVFHDAYLVESYRDSENRPRQRMICYLGNIRQIGSEFPAIERELFFLRAERILQGLPELTAEDRDQVLILLRQKVPELTVDESRYAFRNTVAWYYHYLRRNGMAPPTREQLVDMIEHSHELGLM